MKVDTRVAIVAALIIAGGVWFSTVPAIQPKKERPVLKFLAKVAKLGLWVMLAHSGTPKEVPVYAEVHGTDANGHRILDHGRGW
jgi:hypothetical protein